MEIRKETRKNLGADLFNKFWPNEPKAPETIDVFVRDYSPKGDSLEVDCDYIASKYGEATVENARKFFEYRDSVHDQEEAEHLEAECVGQVIKD